MDYVHTLTRVLHAVIQLGLHLVDGRQGMYGHLPLDWRANIQERVQHSLAWVGTHVLVHVLGDVQAVWTNYLVVRAKQ